MMSQNLLLVICAFFSCNFVGCLEGREATAGKCDIFIKSQLPEKNEPLFLTESSSGKLDFAIPDENGKLTRKLKQELFAACPNSSFESIPNLQAGEFECSSGGWRYKTNKQLDTDDLGCKSRIKGELRIAGACTGGKKIEFGYWVSGQWLSLFHVCHNVSRSSTLYARHTLLGGLLEFKKTKEERPPFRQGLKTLFQGFDPDDAYSRDGLREALVRTYGRQQAEDFISQCPSSSCMHRGHLAPFADFIFGNWQILTQYYANTAPMWSSVNQGGWGSLESATRKFAKETGKTLEVVTGTDGVCRLPDKKGKELYLVDDERLPVPAYIWKILRDPSNSACIGFVIINNPFLTSHPPICNDICSSTGWPSNKETFKRGYHNCCTYSQLRAFSKTVPSLKCTKTLENV